MKRHRIWPAAGVLGTGLIVVSSPLLQQGSVGAAIAVAAATLIAACIHTSLAPSAMAAGSLAALALFGPLKSEPALALALFVALVHTPRLLRASNALGTGIGVALAALAGLAIHYVLGASTASTASPVAMVCVATALSALPLMINVDDSITATIRWAASQERGTRRLGLLRAVALRRMWQSPGPRDVSRALERGWRDLATMAREERFESALSHARALSRAHRAARALQKARRGLDERDMIVEAEERLAAELDALREIQPLRS